MITPQSIITCVMTADDAIATATAVIASHGEESNGRTRLVSRLSGKLLHEVRSKGGGGTVHDVFFSLVKQYEFGGGGRKRSLKLQMQMVIIFVSLWFNDMSSKHTTCYHLLRSLDQT